MCSIRAELNPAEREKLLRDLWVAHDGRWFLRTAEEWGSDAANRLNQATIMSMGKKEARELMERTGTQIADIGDIKKILEMGSELYWPDQKKCEVLGEGLLLLRIRDCYVWDNVNKAGGLLSYRCAAATRLRGWVEAFGVPGEVIASKDVDKCHGSCEISFRFDWPAKGA